MAPRPPTGVTAVRTAGNLSGHETEGAPPSSTRAEAFGVGGRALACDRWTMSESAILRTPLHALHVELGARMAPFAGYDMPIQYPDGHSRRAPAHARRAPACSTSRIWARRGSTAPTTRRRARALERLCPADILGLAPGRQRYTQFLNAEGGVIDDLMVTRPPGADGRLEPRRQRRAQGDRFRAARSSPAGRRRADPARRRGADRLAGPGRRARARAPGARRARSRRCRS